MRCKTCEELRARALEAAYDLNWRGTVQALGDGAQLAVAKMRGEDHVAQALRTMEERKAIGA